MFTFGEAFINTFQEGKKAEERRQEFLTQLLQKRVENREANARFEKQFNAEQAHRNFVETIKQKELDDQIAHNRYMEDVARKTKDSQEKFQEDMRKSEEKRVEYERKRTELERKLKVLDYFQNAGYDVDPKSYLGGYLKEFNITLPEDSPSHIPSLLDTGYIGALGKTAGSDPGDVFDDYSEKAKKVALKGVPPTPQPAPSGTLSSGSLLLSVPQSPGARSPLPFEQLLSGITTAPASGKAAPPITSVPSNAPQSTDSFTKISSKEKRFKNLDNLFYNTVQQDATSATSTRGFQPPDIQKDETPQNISLQPSSKRLSPKVLARVIKDEIVRQDNTGTIQRELQRLGNIDDIKKRKDILSHLVASIIDTKISPDKTRAGSQEVRIPGDFNVNRSKNGLNELSSYKTSGDKTAVSPGEFQTTGKSLDDIIPKDFSAVYPKELRNLFTERGQFLTRLVEKALSSGDKSKRTFYFPGYDDNYFLGYNDNAVRRKKEIKKVFNSILKAFENIIDSEKKKKSPSLPSEIPDFIKNHSPNIDVSNIKSLPKSGYKLPLSDLPLEHYLPPDTNVSSSGVPDVIKNRRAPDYIRNFTAPNLKDVKDLSAPSPVANTPSQPIAEGNIFNQLGDKLKHMLEIIGKTSAGTSSSSYIPGILDKNALGEKLSQIIKSLPPGGASSYIPKTLDKNIFKNELKDKIDKEFAPIKFITDLAKDISTGKKKIRNENDLANLQYIYNIYSQYTAPNENGDYELLNKYTQLAESMYEETGDDSYKKLLDKLGAAMTFLNLKLSTGQPRKNRK